VLIILTQNIHSFQFLLNTTNILEFLSVKTILIQNKMQKPDLDLIVDTLKNIPIVFSETLKILHLIKTLPVRRSIYSSPL